MKKVIATKNAPAAIGPYSQAVQVGNMLFASGQLGIDPATGLFVVGSVKEQAAQAFKNVLPSLANECIVLLKETSVAGYIAVQDLTKGGDTIRSATYEPFMPLIAVAIIYLVIVMVLTHFVTKLERRLAANDKR